MLLFSLCHLVLSQNHTPLHRSAMDYSEQSDVLKAGFLDRKGLMLGRWARRFYILRDTFLFICKIEPAFLSEGIARPDNVIFLNTSGCSCRAWEGKIDKAHPFMFTLSVTEPTKEEHVLAAASEQERAQWIEGICGSIKLHLDAVEAAASSALLVAQRAANSRSGSRNHSHPGSRDASPARSIPGAQHQRQGSYSRSQSGHSVGSGGGGASSGSAGASAAGRLPKPQLRGSSLGHSSNGHLDPTLSQTMPPQGGYLHPDGSDDANSFAQHQQPEEHAAGAAAAASAATSVDNVAAAASPNLPSSIARAGSLRQPVASSSSEQLRLDQFTLRTRSNILGGVEDHDDEAAFASPVPSQLYPQHSLPPLYDDDEPQPGGPAGGGSGGQQQQPQHAGEGDGVTESQSPSSAGSSLHHQRSNTSTTPSLPSSPRVPTRGSTPSLSVSAVDEETRLKLAVIEGCTSDPELQTLSSDLRLIDEKVQKLRLHKRVLANEIKNLTPKLAIQTKVNNSYLEEIQLHRALQGKRSAHRVHVLKWVASVQSRLARAEPMAFLKMHRKLQRQQQQQQQQLLQSGQHNPYVLSTPPPALRAGQMLPTSPATPYSAHLPAGGLTPAAMSPVAPASGSSALISHADLIRLSNTELDSLEREVRAHRPEEPCSPELLTTLQIQEAMYTDADAHRSVGGIEDEEWNREASHAARASPPAPSLGLASSPGSSAAADSYTALLRSHTSLLNDLTHLLVSILLREIETRRQLNLLQGSIHKLTTEKEISFRHTYAAKAAMVGKANKAEKEKKMARIKSREV